MLRSSWRFSRCATNSESFNAAGDTRPLPLTAALLGLALLAKGLVPLVLALPLLFRVRGRSQPKSAFKGRVPDESGRQAESLPYLRELLGSSEWRRAFLDVFFWQQAALTLPTPSSQGSALRASYNGCCSS